jgi:hypothetical protein
MRAQVSNWIGSIVIGYELCVCVVAIFKNCRQTGVFRDSTVLEARTAGAELIRAC